MKASTGFQPTGKAEEQGGSWKSGLAEDALWSDVIREMEGCFWTKADMRPSIEKGVKGLSEALQRYKVACLEEQPFVSDVEEKVTKGYVTVTEEYLASKVASPDAQTVKKITQRQLEITELFDYQLVHPAIRREVSRVLTMT